MPTQDPDHAHAGQRPSAGRIDLIELIMTCGAAADPAEADLLGALSRLQQEILPELRMLRERGRPFLSAGLSGQIDSASRQLPACSSTRLSDLPLAARREAAGWIEKNRTAVLADLESWAPEMEYARLAQLLGPIWGTEKVAGSSSDLVASCEIIAGTRRQLDEIRSTLTGQVQELLSALPAGAAPSDLSSAARDAITSGDPRQLVKVRAALAELGGRQSLKISEDQWLRTCAQLEESCEMGRRKLVEPTGESPTPPHPLLKSALDRAAGALKRAGESTGSVEIDSLQPVIASWDSALRALLSEGAATIAEKQQSRQELAEMLQHNIARHVALDLGLQDHGRKLPTGDIDGTAKTLLASAISGGSSFQEAFEKAISLARTVRGRSEARLKTASSRLRTAAKEMEAFLENAADHLPAARVVTARLWLEQAEGIIASAETPAMDAMSQSLTEDLKELNVLMELTRKRRHSKEAGQRQTLKADASRYLKAATGATAGKLKTLADRIDSADPKELASLRGEIETLGIAVEQSVRRSAGKALAGARRLLPKKEKADTAKLSDKLRNIRELSDALMTAGEKDDLARIGSLAGDLGSAVAAAAPLSRPAVRAGIAAAGIVLAGSGLFAWRSISNRPAVYRLKLAGTEQQSASVLLVRDGKPFRPAEARKGSDIVEIALPEGRYEIFINDRYTGRVVQVPGPLEIDEIPVP